MNSYRSPLQDDQYYEDNRFGSGSWPAPPRPGPPSFLPPPGHHRPNLGSKPYSRPSSSSQAPKYSSRYKLSSYPKELNDMFGALECKLCCVEVTSPIGAKMHYSGKPHMKKVKNFLTEWSLKTGNPLPVFENHTPQPSVSSLADYCELCDVRLISTNDKMLHYSGKTHRKNERDPDNAKKKCKTYDTIDLSATDGRFGIGVGFSSESKELEKVEDVKVNEFICELCDVKAVSQEQLNIHFGGKKHQDKLKKKESGVPKAVNPSVSILASVVKEQPRGSVDYSMHRTPSGRPYKCEMCNVSLETPWLLNLHLAGKPHAKVLKKLESEFKGGSCEACCITFTSFRDYQMHTNGKKHEQKMRQNALRNPVIVKDQKETITCKNCLYVGDLDTHVCDRSFENVKTKIEDSKWKCIPCYNTVFESQEEYEEHKKSRRHLLCMLNVEGDRINEEKKFWYCFTCRKQYHDSKEYCDHLFGHTHMTLSDETCDLGSKTDLWHCSVCAIIMDQQAKEEHMMSKSHLVQAAQQDITRKLTALANEELGTNMFHCTHCDINLLNFVAFSEHILNPKHMEEIVLAKLNSY